MQQAASNVDVLANGENVKIMSNILKTNVSACTSIGPFFLPQLGRVWLDMLGLYKAVSGIISDQVEQQGQPRIRSTSSTADMDKVLLRQRPPKSVHCVPSRRRFSNSSRPTSRKPRI